jgi:hypothetical protein
VTRASGSIRGVRRLLTAIVLAALALPAPASAAPEDPPVEAVLPADGAVLPTNADGIEVRYTCPEPYRIAGESPFATYGDRSDYGVSFATSPALGNDGRLSEANVVALAGSDDVQDNDIPVGQCRGFMAESGKRPQTTPGTYYWQAWRTCLACPGDYETSVVRSFRLTAAGSGVKLAVKPPARAYRGFPFVVSVTTTGLDPGAAVALQVKRGSAWRKVANVTATGRTDEAAVLLPKRLRPGRHPLRAQARVGDETLTSAARRVRLRRAAKWTTSGRQDGRWKGKAAGLPVSFRVSGHGRTIRAGRFQLTLLCPTPGMLNPFTIQIADAPLPRARIAPDGSFVFAGVVSRSASFVHGRIGGRKAGGSAALSLGVCTGSARFRATRGG